MEQPVKSDLNIRQHNIRPHVDIELDIMARKEGNITFTLRINAGNIVDYNLVEYVDVKRKYGRLDKATTTTNKQPSVPRVTGKGSK